MEIYSNTHFLFGYSYYERGLWHRMETPFPLIIDTHYFWIRIFPLLIGVNISITKIYYVNEKNPNKSYNSHQMLFKLICYTYIY